MANTVVGLKNVNFLTEEQFNTTTFDNTQMYAVETAPPLTVNQITNCITENPELVKLSLSGGTLTFEAGSTVIVPYGKSAPTMAIGDSLNGGTISDISWDGTLLFYYVRYDSAKTFVSYHNGSSICFLHNNGDTRTLGPISLMHSGTIAPTTTQYMLWYDTNNNIVKYTGDTGSTWTNYQSLVFAIASGTGGASSSAWTSIDQVFKSIGYIGSTVYALPGVKGLIPDGRNADGSLRNIEFVTDRVLVDENPDAGNRPIKILLYPDKIESWGSDNRNIMYYKTRPDVAPVAFCTAYIEDENKWIRSLGSTAWAEELICTDVGDYQLNNSNIVAFYPKLPFRALDYNDKETIISSFSFAPKPTSSAGVGQWQFAVTEVNTVRDNYALPSGGTWVWVAFQTNGADSVMKIGGGIDAGGTILLGGNNWRINTTFCTGAYKEVGYHYQIIIIRYRIA